MTVGLIILAGFALSIFVFGLLIGYRLSERKRATQARRQAAAHSFLYKQLRELQAARQENLSVPRRVGVLS